MKKLTPIFSGSDLQFCSHPVPAIDAHKAVGSSFSFNSFQIANYGQSQTHPSIVYIAAGWNGHKWWMATTPYPIPATYDERMSVFENPCIYYADDESGNPPRTWYPINGAANGAYTMVTNPIVRITDSTPNSAGNVTVNSDPALYFDAAGNGGAGVLWLISRENSNGFAVYAQKSLDGQSWTPRGDRTTGFLWKYNTGGLVGEPEFLSPALLKVGSELRAYCLASRSALEAKDDRKNKGMNWGVWIMKGTTLEGSGDFTYWKKACFTGKINIEPWHYDIFKDNSTGYYYAVIVAKDYDVDLYAKWTYLAESTDGLNFRIFPRPLTNTYINYRPTACLQGSNLVLYWTTESGAPTTSGSYPRGSADIPVDAGRAIGLSYKNFQTILTTLRADEVKGWVD